MAATSYQSIKDLSFDFKDMLNNNSQSLPFDVNGTSMVVFVDVANDLGDILAANPAKLAIVIALEDNKPTVCILGANSNGTILTAHLNGSLDGQQRWPDTMKIKFSQSSAYSRFFV
ncbi:MAG TPA: hypothetical protein VD993_16070 [Chitinophagaceae bacterium]|nr:hypothetical protein [Chitinophagaceae bacterium]